MAAQARRVHAFGGTRYRAASEHTGEGREGAKHPRTWQFLRLFNSLAGRSSPKERRDSVQSGSRFGETRIRARDDNQGGPGWAGEIFPRRRTENDRLA